METKSVTPTSPGTDEQKALTHMWFISNGTLIYVGGRLTRKEAIDEHCGELGITWKDARKSGDRAVKCRVEAM